MLAVVGCNRSVIRANQHYTLQMLDAAMACSGSALVDNLVYEYSISGPRTETAGILGWRGGDRARACCRVWLMFPTLRQGRTPE